MMMPLLHLLVITMTTLPPSINAIVPPKTPVLSGFEPAAIGSNRELVCDAFQPDAGTITYKWFKHSVDNGVENWETRGNIGTSQKYVFNPVTETKYFHPSSVYPAKEVVSGKYKCRASNSAGIRDSEWGDLYVYTPCTRSLYNVSVTPTKPAIGDTFTLNCYIPRPSGFTVSWLKKTDASSTASVIAVANSLGCHKPGVDVSQDQRYDWSSCSPPSFSLQSKTFNLQVTNAQAADFAYWLCQDIGLKNCKTSNPVKPVVQAPPDTPHITGFPSGPVTVGEKLNLKCVASPPGDNYDWFKGGRNVTTSLSYDFQVKKESAGVYKCTARNAVGSATSSNNTLVVYHKADSIVVSSWKKSSHVGKKDKFTCTVSGGSPTPTMKIYLKMSNGTLVEVTQGQDKVMTKEDNQAEYYCEAKVSGYPALDMTSSRKTYNVTFPHTKVSFLNNPTAPVQVKKIKKFTCETDESNPITYIKWYQSTSSTWQNITANILSSKTSGLYGGEIRTSEWSVTATKAMNHAKVRCTSTYPLKVHGFTYQADTDMYVKFPPNGIQLSETSITVKEGVTKTITCNTTSSSNPAVSGVSVKKRLGPLEVDVTGTSRVTNGAYHGKDVSIDIGLHTNRKANGAQYICSFTYASTTFKETATVNVQFPPNGIQLSETSITVKEGVTKTITCSTTSSSNPVVSGVSVKKRLGSLEVDVTGTSRETNGTNNGKDVSIDIKLDTNRTDNGAQYNCSLNYNASTTFKKTASVNVQFNPSKITMAQKALIIVHEGKLITIVCETDSANPVANIQFHRKRTGGTWEQLTSRPEDRPGENNGRIRKSILTMTAYRLDTQAVFKCGVKEGSFQVEQTVTVNVYYPPNVTISFTPSPVKEGDTLTLACAATGGNPTSYNYKWFYKNKEIPNETSKDYKITNIKYTQSGTYKCEVTNYSPDVKPDASMNIDIQYKAKWNPEISGVFTVASKLNTPMKFFLHVIANPVPTNVTWFLPNKKPISTAFTATKVNDTTYTLSKEAVGSNDYGNYTVNVTNDVGISTFAFELEKAGPPDTPCCLAAVNITAVSITLTFTSGFAGGSAQTFTIENRTSGGNAWDIAVKGIADPDFGNNVAQKISELDSNTDYEFRVKATNADGDSGYGEILKAKTGAAPNATLTVERKDNQVTVSWPKLLKEYTKIQIKYCPKEGGSCVHHVVLDPTSLKSSFTVKEGNTYTYSMKIFDGEDLVFVSVPGIAPSHGGPPAWQIAGGVGGFLFLLIIIAVVLALVFVLKRRRAEKDAEILNTANNNGDANGGQVNPGFSDLDARHSDVTDGFNPYEDSVEMTSPSSSIQIEATAVTGGAEYAVVNKKGSKKPPVGGAYAEVDFKKKKGGKKGSAPPQPGGQAYAEVDFSKKSKGKGKGKAPVPSAGPGGQAYAEVDFTKKAKKGEAPASSAGPGDVYAEVSKPKKPSKPTKPGKPGSDDLAVYANVPNGDADEENLYEDVRKDEPTENGYRQPKEAYQVGVDGTIYSQVQISPPKNPDVIRGKDTMEEYASVDFSLQAPPDDPNDPGFLVLL